MLKALNHDYIFSQADLDTHALQQLFAYWSENRNHIDIKKFLTYTFPLIHEPDIIKQLLTLLHITEYKQQIDVLLPINTLAAQYTLFTTLKYAELNHEQLKHYALLLLKKGDDASYNLLSIIKLYFNIQDIPATFSLTILSHELSYIDSSYTAFCKVMKRF